MSNGSTPDPLHPSTGGVKYVPSIFPSGESDDDEFPTYGEFSLRPRRNQRYGGVDEESRPSSPALLRHSRPSCSVLRGSRLRTESIRHRSSDSLEAPLVNLKQQRRRHLASGASAPASGGVAPAHFVTPTAATASPLAFSTSPSPIDLAAAADAPGGRTSGSVYRPPVVKTRTTLNSSAGGRRGSLVGAAPKAAPTPKETALSTYGRDMTVVAGMTDPVIGRDDEIDRVVCILCRRTKNSALLVGAPGVGKTAIAEGLARRIAGGMVPAALAGARVVEVDLGAMVAGTQYRGMFEQRLKDVIKEAEDADGQVVLFIDEVHMLVGPGKTKGGSMDGANLLKPALARGRIRCVGAPTFDEYRKTQKVHVEEPSTQATICILRGLKQRYEDHHGLKIQDAALVAAAQLAGRYITGRQFPDKAIDLIDEACSTTWMQIDSQRQWSATQSTSARVVRDGVLCPDHVAQIVSRWTGIPVATLDEEEKEKLIHLANRLHERVVDQDEADRLVWERLSSQKLLLSNYSILRRCWFRFDMSEYVNSGSVLRLIGAPPSYHGHEDGGQLTEKIRRRPYSVILFEVEKADPSVFNVFLQLLDDARGLVMEQVQKCFKPELLNRLSEVVIFEPLSHDKLKEVVKIQMKIIISNVANKGISLVASDDALDVILLESYNPMYGARPIRRWVHKNVMTKLSELLVKGEVDEGTMVSVDARTDKKGLEYQVVKKVIEARGKKPVMEVPSDSYDSDDVVEVFPVAKKAKVVGF
ncbi:chaperone protein ClpB1-like [Aegilops tauschii subsp. strangulata]|uniref:ATP-dependent Clp protease ATP-binding subunit clpC n=1 Tax=Aegilops tauschii TaxID=37682 RepID=M8ALG5_AEGTA